MQRATEFIHVKVEGTEKRENSGRPGASRPEIGWSSIPGVLYFGKKRLYIETFDFELVLDGELSFLADALGGLVPWHEGDREFVATAKDAKVPCDSPLFKIRREKMAHVRALRDWTKDRDALEHEMGEAVISGYCAG